MTEPYPAERSAAIAEAFTDPSVVAAYPLRPPYPDGVLGLVVELAGPRPHYVLDIGCGNGDIARPLAPRVDRLDAVDVSEAMLRVGAGLPGGGHPNLRWQLGRVEDAPLNGGYAVVTAGESIHWMDWDVVLPRLAAALRHDGPLVIAGRDWYGAALNERLTPLFAEYSWIRDFRSYDLLAELERRKLFESAGRRTFTSEWSPTVDEYLECAHSHAGCSRERMGSTVPEFDARFRAALEEAIRDGVVRAIGDRIVVEVTASATWGTPKSG